LNSAELEIYWLSTSVDDYTFSMILSAFSMRLSFRKLLLDRREERTEAVLVSTKADSPLYIAFSSLIVYISFSMESRIVSLYATYSSI